MHLTAQPRIAPGAKQETARQWLTAGVVLASAGMIAASPLSPVPANIQHDIQAGAVRLTAGWDPLAPWKDALDTAKANGTILADNFLLAPGVGLQQAIANQIGYAKQLVDDPASFEAVAKQFAANAQKVATSLTLLGADDDTTKTALRRTLGGLHGTILSLLPGFLPEGTDVETVTAVLNILSSPLSGVLIGSVGPAISPAVALLNSAIAIADAIKAGDSTTAFSDLVGVPASMVNAFFNGADLNLNALTPLINGAGVLPEGTTIDALDFAFGGLLTPGSTSGETYGIKDENGEVIKTIPSPGGSIFNSLGLTITTNALGSPITLPIESEAVGPIGALQGLSQTVGVLLGSGWDDPKGYAPDWDGKGNPPPPPPPLFGLQPHALGDIFSDTAESASVTKLRDMLKTATVNDIVKTLQGVGTDTQTADETAADTKAADTPVAASVAAANELTHATTNKTVAVSLQNPDTTAGTDETAGAATESAEASSTDAKTEPTKPTAQTQAETGATRPSTSANTPSRTVAKGIKDAVKNVRNGLNGHRTSSESSASSASNSSSNSSHSPAKAKAAKTKNKN